MSPVKVSVCFIPSQDSRRERSNNFQAFVKMALETLLGSCRRKHGGPRGKQGWEPDTFLLSLQTGLLHGQFQHSICSPLAENVNLTSIHHHLLFNPFTPHLPSSPKFLCPLPQQMSTLVYWMLRNILQVKPDHCFELKKTVCLSFPSFPDSLSTHDRLFNSPNVLLVNNHSNKHQFLTAVCVFLCLIYPPNPNSIKQRRKSRFRVKFYKNITGVSVPSHLQGEQLAQSKSHKWYLKYCTGCLQTEHWLTGMNKHSGSNLKHYVVNQEANPWVVEIQERYG